MTAVSTLGIDLAKNTFSVHGVDAQGVVTVRRTVSRAKLGELVARLPPCLIGMEACSGAHEWARRFSEAGHTAKLMAPKFVTPYRKSGKNDGNDAEAICEAVGRPNMRFVPIKSVQQQCDLSLHRVRLGFVEERTATLNRIRGLIAEFGYVVPLGTERLRREVRDLLERLPARAASCVRDLLEHAERLRSKALEYEREIRSSLQHNELALRAHTRPGIGPITASALVATVGNGHDFRNGRQFSAWLGLVPRQYSTGGKTRLGHITKRGDPYLRTLLVMGARSVLQRAYRETDPLSRWALALQQRRGYHRACVAIAAKNARVAWALLAKGAAAA
ncbi:MAG: IS110 family transposase [Gammaproteobacteria bacterium]|jgi:transposase|nr:MAG: IS110 family transposase [Gammaproteobacteria bacterium]